MSFYDIRKVIVLDNLSQSGLDLLEAVGNVDYEVHTGLKGQELRGHARSVRRGHLP